MSVEHAPDLDATHARQARRGRHAFVILVVSLTAAIAVVFGVWAGFSGRFSGETGNREAPPAVASSVTTTPAAAKQAADGSPKAP